MSKLPILFFFIQVIQHGLVLADSPTVDLGYARYQGVYDQEKNVSNFLGVRYAAPPVGDLRWRAPQPPSPMADAIQAADSYPPQCLQANLGFSSTNPYRHPANQNAKREELGTSEDCLFLNVHFPGDEAPSTKLPVIVWFHGGGYAKGNASMYHGSDLISQSREGVVVVTVQYRLGAFGFLSGNEVKADGALNAGILDQNFALRWIREHISKFGGDPAKVTIWGQSSGAGSVIQHVIAEDGQTNPPLFRGAISSSSHLPPQYAFNDTIPQALYRKVVDIAGCTPASDTLSCLRQADTDTIEAANVAISAAGFFGTFTFVPVVDGTFIRRRATEAFRQGKVNGEALLAITNSNEGDRFVNQTAIPLSASQFAAELFPKFPSEKTEEVAQLYAGLGSALVQENHIFGDAIFNCPTYYFLKAFEGRSYKALFALPPAIHLGDVPFYWPTSGTPLPYNNTDFTNAFAQSFISFALSLDPNVKVDPTNITPPWEKYSEGNVEMAFNKTENDLPIVHDVTTDADLLARCRFWESVSGINGQ